MNNDALIRESLLFKNKVNHEESECLRLSRDTEVEGCRWINISDASTLDFAGLPIYLDEEGNALLAGFSHATVIGSTGTGKSEVMIKNAIQLFSLLKQDVKPSFVASDLKGDISAQLYPHLVENGYKVIILDMKKPYQSTRYNFMSQIYDAHHEALRLKRMIADGSLTEKLDAKVYPSVEAAKRAANAKILTLHDRVEKAIVELANIIIICNDPKSLSWVQGARTMCSAIVMTMLHDSENPKCGMTKDKFTMANACRAAFHTDDDCDEIVDWLKRADYKLMVKNAVTANYALRAKITRDSYISTLNTALGPYTSNAVSTLTSTTDVNLREIAKRDEPYAIFLITDDRQKVTNSIAMMFINDLVAELTRVADTKGARALKRDFVFLLDEFANMPPMPEMSNKITTLRSRRMWMIMAIQSIQQLNQVYGDDTSEIIRDNCDLSIFLGSNNLGTKEVFAGSMGKHAGISASYQKANDGTTSESITTADIPVVRISDLDSLSLGHFYVRARTFTNLVSYMVPYFTRKEAAVPAHTVRGIFRSFDAKATMYDIKEAMERENSEAV